MDEKKTDDNKSVNDDEGQINLALQEAAAIEGEAEAQYIAKLSQNYMIQQNLEKTGPKGTETQSPPRASRQLSQRRQSNSQARTQ